MKITRRYGTSPRDRGSMGGETCPDVLKLDNGDFLIIGKRTGPGIHAQLGEHHASIGLDETAVVVPAEVLRAAALDIATEALWTKLGANRLRGYISPA